MNIEQFRLLHDTEKEEIVWEEGNFLATYDEEEMLCDVYRLYDFYVAFSYELHKNENVAITAASDTDGLPVKILLKQSH